MVTSESNVIIVVTLQLLSVLLKYLGFFFFKKKFSPLIITSRAKSIYLIKYIFEHLPGIMLDIKQELDISMT